jgi:hypothetical protein
MLFNKVSYRRGVIEGLVIYALGRLGACITPGNFPGWFFVLVPLIFIVLQYILPPVWAARRMRSTKRERLSKRFWALGPRLAALCLVIDIVVSLCVGASLRMFDVQPGPAILRMFAHGSQHLTIGSFVISELITAVILFTFYTIAVVCTRLANGGFLRFTMPAGENRVTL